MLICSETPFSNVVFVWDFTEAGGAFSEYTVTNLQDNTDAGLFYDCILNYFLTIF